MFAFLAALIAAPLLVVVAPVDSPTLQSARATASGLAVEGWSQRPGPVCAQNPACVAGGVNRGDAVLWTSPIDSRVLVRVARRPDGAIIVEELVDTEAAVGAAVERLVGQVPAGLARLNTTAPLAAAVVADAPDAAAPAVVVAEEGVPVIWWVVGGVAVAAVIAGVFVGALVLGDARQSGNAGDGCGACLNGVFGNCFVCTAFSDSINSACTSACGDVTGSFTDSCNGIGDGLTGACDGLGNVGSCALPAPAATSTPPTIAPVLLPSGALTQPNGPADGNMAW